MGEVIWFRSRSVPTNRKGYIPISIWVTDADEPERTRWIAQFEIQNAASFRALKQFTDTRARNGTRHPFSCAPDRLNDFIAKIEPLIDAGRVRVEVAGVRVRARSQRRRA